MIQPFTMGRVENIRHILPIGRGQSHGAVGYLCGGCALPYVVSGITIAPIWAGEKSGEKLHDDF